MIELEEQELSSISGAQNADAVTSAVLGAGAAIAALGGIALTAAAAPELAAGALAYYGVSAALGLGSAGFGLAALFS